MPKWEPAADWGLWAFSDPRLSNPSQDAKEVLLWSREELGVNIAVPPCLHSFLTHNKHHLFENKVWEINIFIKKCIRSLLKSSLQLIMFLCICIRVYVCGYTTQWSWFSSYAIIYQVFKFGKRSLSLLLLSLLLLSLYSLRQLMFFLWSLSSRMCLQDPSSFAFHNHAQVFLCAILLFWHLKYPYRYFYSHFCFLIIVVLLMFMLFVLFIVTVINLSLSLFCFFVFLFCFFFFSFVISLLASFSLVRLLIVFPESQYDSEISQISRTLVSILTDLNNVVVWMDSAHPLISKSCNPLVTVLSAPITNGTKITFMFHIFSVL